MVVFGIKPWVNPFKKMSIFRVFEPLFFFSLERRFFVLEYHKTHFSCLYCLKKKLEEWLFLDQNHGLTPLEKCEFSTFRTSCFDSLERRFFVLEYYKRHFPGLYCLKKESWKNGHFWSKPWVNPFGKMSIFRLFLPLFFFSLGCRFFVLEYHKTHFLAYIP